MTHRKTMVPSLNMWPRMFAGLVLVWTLSACDRAPVEPSVSEPRAAQARDTRKKEVQKQPRSDSTVGSDSASGVEQTGAFRFPGGPRIVAIGDLHGDLQATERAFRLAGAIDEKGNWAGGKLILVQTGDQLDRGDDERAIVDFLARLKKEAAAGGGALFVLNGNHETMNVLGDFRYVTPAAMDAFSDMRPNSPLTGAMPDAVRSRAAPFLPGGGAARLLAERPLVVMVGDTVFVHGGVTPAHVEYGIDRLNEQSAEWMKGDRRSPPGPVVDSEGPLWTRIYGEPTLGAKACEVLAATLGRLGAKRMVVGHTVQQKGMSGACDDRVWRIDVGLSHYYGDHPVQVLEIRGDDVKVLTEP